MGSFDDIPWIDEIYDVLKFMTPIMREKLLEYLQYTWLTLAQDSLQKEDMNRDMERWWFAVLFKMREVFSKLKLSKPKKEDSK